MNKTTVDVICEDCNERFTVTPSMLDTTRYANFGEIIYVMSYDCPKCGRKHMVQADTDYTKKLLENCEKSMRIVTLQRAYGGTPKKKDVKRFEKCRKKLMNQRNEVMKFYNNKEVTNLDKKCLETLVFSSL